MNNSFYFAIIRISTPCSLGTRSGVRVGHGWATAQGAGSAKTGTARYLSVNENISLGFRSSSPVLRQNCYHVSTTVNELLSVRQNSLSDRTNFIYHALLQRARLQLKMYYYYYYYYYCIHMFINTLS